MKATKEMLKEIRSCCHNGHGAALFSDGTVIQGIDSNSVLARQKTDENGEYWDYRIAYISDPRINLEFLQEILDQSGEV